MTQMEDPLDVYIVTNLIFPTLRSPITLKRNTLSVTQIRRKEGEEDRGKMYFLFN
jgi:hypothetical protein